MDRICKRNLQLGSDFSEGTNTDSNLKFSSQLIRKITTTNAADAAVIYNPVNTFGLLKKRLNFIRRFRSLKSSYDLLSYELP